MVSSGSKLPLDWHRSRATKLRIGVNAFERLFHARWRRSVDAVEQTRVSFYEKEEVPQFKSIRPRPPATVQRVAFSTAFHAFRVNEISIARAYEITRRASKYQTRRPYIPAFPYVRVCKINESLPFASPRNSTRLSTLDSRLVPRSYSASLHTD